MASKILKQSVPMWITQDGEKHFTRDQAVRHQQKVDLKVALANLFDEADFAMAFRAEDYTPPVQAAEELVNDDESFKALLRFFNAMQDALTPEEQNKF